MLDSYSVNLSKGELETLIGTCIITQNLLMQNKKRIRNSVRGITDITRVLDKLKSIKECN